jgi:23S rRNA pseudouridine1911/1915/1917 synthase
VWLSARVPDISRSQLRRRIEAGEVTVNGSRVLSASRSMRPGERVVFAPAPVEEVADRPEDIPLSILYEDDALVILDKPAGMVVHPATSHQAGTLVNALLHHCGESLRGIGGERRPGIVHRLDKDTSGVMIVAKDEPTLTALQVQFHDHTLERRYLALVEGVVAAQGTFRTHYGRDPRDRKKFSSKIGGGRTAITHWVVKERFRGATLVEARLETGRTHQIRVHFKDAGHPLLGDPIYGRRPREPHLRAIHERLGRQALHAAVLGITHPRDGRLLRFETAPPADLEAALRALRKDAAGS